MFLDNLIYFRRFIAKFYQSMNASRSSDARINPHDWEQILRETRLSRDDLEAIVAMMALELKHLFSFVPEDTSYRPLYSFRGLPFED
jgi:hypothetical protein